MTIHYRMIDRPIKMMKLCKKGYYDMKSQFSTMPNTRHHSCVFSGKETTNHAWFNIDESNFEMSTTNLIAKPTIPNWQEAHNKIWSYATKPKFNFQKVKPEKFTAVLDTNFTNTSPVPQRNISFRIFYGNASVIKNLYKALAEKPNLVTEKLSSYNVNFSAENPGDHWKTLMTLSCEDMSDRLTDVIMNINLAIKTYMPWITMKKFDSNRKPPKRSAAITLDEV